MKYSPLLICLLLFYSCQPKEDKTTESVEKNLNNIVISANIKNAENKVFYLYDLGSEQPKIMDSSKVLNNKIEINTQLTEKFNILGLGNNQKNLMLFIGQKKDTISLTSSFSESLIDYEVSGSESSVLLKEYLSKKLELNEQFSRIQQQINELSFEAQNEREDLMLQAQVIKNSFEKIKNDFILNNQNSPAIFIALYDISNLVEEQGQLEVIAEVISKYFSNTIFQQEVILRMNKANQQIAMLKQQTAMAEAQKNELKNAGLIIGKPAPELNYPNKDGKLLSLKSLKGKVVLLDFWASWCGPCRKENPFVVSLYNKYKNSGFEIYSFSLDNKKEKWVQAIEQDGLIWDNHVSDLSGWKSSGAAKYLIKSIPQTFIIDRNGNIAEIGLRGPDLEKKILNLL